MDIAFYMDVNIKTVLTLESIHSPTFKKTIFQTIPLFILQEAKSKFRQMILADRDFRSCLPTP